MVARETFGLCGEQRCEAILRVALRHQRRSMRCFLAITAKLAACKTLANQPGSSVSAPHPAYCAAFVHPAQRCDVPRPQLAARATLCVSRAALRPESRIRRDAWQRAASRAAIDADEPMPPRSRTAKAAADEPMPRGKPSNSVDDLLEPMPPTQPRAKRLLTIVTVAAWLYAMSVAIGKAYDIRLHAIKTYGYVIHEFDPWFNYRATEYLAANGLRKFFTWFDRMAWYPLGRPVGTTIYPGMQMTSVFIWQTLGKLRELGLLTWYAHVKKAPISLNDVCCLVPAWFGALATVFLGLLTLETTNSYAASACAALCMATVPAHLMRSVGGGYDNESIALTAMCATFYLWCRSLRGPYLCGNQPVRRLRRRRAGSVER